jgi:hypothetical protein
LSVASYLLGGIAMLLPLNHVVYWSRLVLLVAVLASSEPLAAQIIGPGELVVAVRESPIMSGDETLAVARFGDKFLAKRVKGDWISIDVQDEGKTISGWIERGNVIRGEMGLGLCRYANEYLNARHYRWWELPQGKMHLIRFESAQPVDLFIVSEEGKGNYEYAVKHRGQMHSYWRKKFTQTANYRWTPPDNRKYYLIVDNTTFPDTGASGDYSTQFTMSWWHDE